MYWVRDRGPRSGELAAALEYVTRLQVARGRKVGKNPGGNRPYIPIFLFLLLLFFMGKEHGGNIIPGRQAPISTRGTKWYKCYGAPLPFPLC